MSLIHFTVSYCLCPSLDTALFFCGKTEVFVTFSFLLLSYIALSNGKMLFLVVQLHYLFVP